MREGGQGGPCCGDPKAPGGPEAGLGQPALTIRPDDQVRPPLAAFHRIRAMTPPAQPTSASGTQAHSLLVCGWWAGSAFYVFKWLGGKSKEKQYIL